MFLIHPAVRAQTTEMYFGHDLLKSDLLSILSKKWGSQSVIIADANLHTLSADLAQRLDAHLISIPNLKTRLMKRRLEDRLLKMKCGRDTLIIAVGGGTILDLAGFVAATYLRGVPLILVPTTLLAVVDASIGGKTAIDTPFGKNCIGSIYHPKAIIADLETLRTEKDPKNGLSEILKMGLIVDPVILEMAETDAWIERAIRAKIAIIEQDPTEQGLRRILNFGHTIGHAIETITQIPHGQAIAFGCLAASDLSARLGYLSGSDFTKIMQIFSQRLNLSRLPSRYDRQALLHVMARDKKAKNQEIRFVLIDAIGHAMPFDGAYCRSVEIQDLEATLNWMEKTFAH